MALRPCKECKQQISSDAKVCPHCGKKVGVSAGSGCLVVILAVIILSALGSILHRTENGGSGTPTASPKDTALSQIKLDFNWRKVGFDNVMEADFTVKNDNSYDIQDFQITCKHFSSSGTEIDSNTRTIYDIVKAHSTKKFIRFNMGFIHSQAVKSSCRITDLIIAP